MSKHKFNPNWIGLALIIGAFGYSSFRFALISINLAREVDPDRGKQVVRVLHWQLEPGYREGLDAVIDDYNALPHVRDNNIEVRQLAVTERVYAQFINVHLISGTAPDISQKGMSPLLGTGGATARFFAPISEHVEAPNPYNAPDLLPDDLDPELAEFLANSAWSETFTDGMLGGWDDIMQDYYAVPVSSPGSVRTFYNVELVAEIKSFLAEHWHAPQQPHWLRRLIEEENLVTPDDAFVAWVDSPDIPDSLGRFLIFNEAVLEFAKATPDYQRLVPIAASNYWAGTMLGGYVLPFTYHLADRIDLNRDSYTSPQEVLGTWQAGWWDFDHPALADGYYEVVRWLSRYYPAGFLGLDREQATRRFLNRQAVFVSSGGWDAPTLFETAPFTVRVTRTPLPIEGERWYDLTAGRSSEAEARLGVPLAIYNRSPNQDIAVDFLRYLSSYPANQKLNEIAGWVPSVVGALPVEQMRPFLPVMEGLKASVRVNLENLPTVGHVYEGIFPLFLSGEINYQEFSDGVREGFEHDRRGVDRMWAESFLSTQDRVRQTERSMILVHLEAEQTGWDEEQWRKYLNLLDSNLRELDGFAPPATFHRLFEDRTFPEY